jgi:hypothetical protein
VLQRLLQLELERQRCHPVTTARQPKRVVASPRPVDSTAAGRGSHFQQQESVQQVDQGVARKA